LSFFISYAFGTPTKRPKTKYLKENAKATKRFKPQNVPVTKRSKAQNISTTKLPKILYIIEWKAWIMTPSLSVIIMQYCTIDGFLHLFISYVQDLNSNTAINSSRMPAKNQYYAQTMTALVPDVSSGD
jgi:hypothetical protein